MADKNLTVKITGDNQGLSRSLRTSKGQLKQFGASLKDFGKKFGVLGAGLVGTAAVAAPLKVFLDATKEIDSLGKLGKQFGFTVEQIQIFERVADLTGTNLEKLLKGFGNLTKAIVQFARDGTGTGVKVFKELGLSAEELESSFKKGPVEVLRVFGDALNKIEDPIRRGALISELLGNREKELAVALADVAKEFGGAAKDIKQLNLALSNEDVQVVEDYNDAWTRVFNTIENRSRKASVTITKLLLPAVKALEEELTGALSAADDPGAKRDVSRLDKLKLAGRVFAETSPMGPAFTTHAKVTSAAIERGIESALNKFRERFGRGVEGAGKMLGFPLTGAALGALARPPAQSMPLVPDPGTGFITSGRGTRSIADILAPIHQGSRTGNLPGGLMPSPGTGTIARGGNQPRTIQDILAEERKQTGFLESLSSDSSANYILNQRAGARTAVAAE